ncbi:MAG TPA: cell division protein SepF [Bacillales bacterium]|nr:cell division protein SepF [Bacillales bacterium]
MGLKSKIMSYFDLNDDGSFQEEPNSDRHNVVSLKSVHRNSRNSRLLLKEPKAFAEVQTIADELKNHRAVVMNFQKAASSEAKRMIDFLSGTVYAIDGTMQKLGPLTFLCTPETIDVSGVISDSLAEKKGSVVDNA